MHAGWRAGADPGNAPAEAPEARLHEPLAHADARHASAVPSSACRPVATCALAGLQALPKEIQACVFSHLELKAQHALATTCRDFWALWTTGPPPQPQESSPHAEQRSPQEQWRTQVVHAAAERLGKRVRWDIVLRTLSQAEDHAALFSREYLNFRADVFLGPRELA